MSRMERLHPMLMMVKTRGMTDTAPPLVSDDVASDDVQNKPPAADTKLFFGNGQFSSLSTKRRTISSGVCNFPKLPVH